jgi:hypothetical protein
MQTSDRIHSSDAPHSAVGTNTRLVSKNYPWYFVAGALSLYDVLG